MIDWIRFGLTACCVAAGLLLMFTAVLAQYRLHYVLNRMHGAGMADSLGLVLIVIGLCVSAPDGWVIVKLLMTSAFLWIASPTASHLIARLEVTTDAQYTEEMEVTRK